MKKYKMLFAGESWLTHNMEVKGWDDFSVGGYGTEIDRIHAAMDEFAEITHLPSHLVGEKFPSTMEELKTYDVVILSDVGANTLLLHPLVFTQSVRFPNRLQLLADYVEQGGALGMMGGYMTFQGIGGKGCFVAEPDLALFREQSLRQLEDHLAAAAELGRTCGLSEPELAELLRRKWEESL